MSGAHLALVIGSTARELGAGGHLEALKASLEAVQCSYQAAQCVRHAERMRAAGDEEQARHYDQLALEHLVLAGASRTA